MSKYNFTSIGTIRSCYKEKFGIPRQPGLVASHSTIEIDPAYSNKDAFREIETFSHIWVIFVFHGTDNKSWKPTVRPPRLGGNQRIGVFASRSMFRPNPVGLSVVELKSIERKEGLISLNIIGGDFLDLTPVIDIKPYIPYVDSIETEKAGYAITKPEAKYGVMFSDDAAKTIEHAKSKYPQLRDVIKGVLQMDPRPAYKESQFKEKEYAVKLYDYDVKWKVEGENIIVMSLVLLV